MAPHRISKKSKTETSLSSSLGPKSRARKMKTDSTESKASKVSSSASQASSDTIFFWREYGTEHCYMSQWYQSPFTTDKDGSIVFLSAEQYMMYQKAILFEDSAVAEEILNEEDPKLIKALGRRVQNFDEKIWYKNRERIVEDASYFKFKNGKALGEDMNGEVGEVGVLLAKLLATGDRELVEASPMDRIWGVGFGAKNAESRRSHWGLNLLGKALMKARQKLREEANTTS